MPHHKTIYRPTNKGKEPLRILMHFQKEMCTNSRPGINRFSLKI